MTDRTLAELLREPEDAVEDLEPYHPVAVLRRLERSRRFHRDPRLGRVYHPGAVSLRENVATDSLHVVVDGDRIAAHVDRVSPLNLGASGGARYALGRVALHNVAGAAGDIARALRGRQGDHRCELDCEWVPDLTDGRRTPLLDPQESPWGVHVEARVGGSLDEGRLRDALRQITGEDRLSVVDGSGDAALGEAREALAGEAVALDCGPPLLARLVRHPGGDTVTLNVNHAAADGPGALGVLRSLARAYAGDADVAPHDFLATLDLPVVPVPSRRHGISRRYQATMDRVRDALARPVRLMPDHASDRSGHGFHLVTLGPDDPGNLAAVSDPDLDNDVLVTALHLAVAAWNAEHRHPEGRIAALLPVDLRFQPWPDSVVGNLSVTARVSTTPAQRTSASDALAAVSSQTVRNIRTRTGTALIHALERNDLLPLWARQSVVVLQPLTANHLLDSAVLSYLGRLEPIGFGDAGDAVEMWISTPARMPSGLAVGGAMLGGRLHLAFRYPYRLFAPEAARRFAQCFLAQLRLVVAASGGA
ncbi:MAG TPA: hypothetical protein VFJ85_15065 [Acidimicrobiales bacterium]|nr:hypothetical protein [Acidimicrobiales bacterium]